MAEGSYRKTLGQRGVGPFLWTQFLGAFNDNVFKIVVILIAAAAPGGEATAAVALAGAMFIAPFLFFSGYAGDLADRFSKRRVLVAMKVFETVTMALAVPALASGRFDVQLGVLFLMGVQATFFSPAKYGIVPELVGDRDLSRANGLLEMSTFVAIVLGTAIGGPLFVLWRDRPEWIGVVLTVIAVAGTLACLRIPEGRAARPETRVSWNPFGETWRSLRRVYPDRTLWMTIVGISYFWFLGALLQMALALFGRDAIHVAESEISWLMTALALGIGAGSLAAGRLSGDKVELGLVPAGAFGMGVFSLGLAWAPTFSQALAALACVGFFGGWFVVPLNALVQQRPAAGETGRVLAANNVLNTIGIVLASAALALLGDVLHVSIRSTILIAGLVTLASSVYVLAILPDFFVRFVLWLVTHTVYRIKIVGRPNIPQRGPALIIANHVSMIDGALVGACVQRFVRFLVYGPYFRKPLVRGLLERMHAIPVTAGNRREVHDAIERARTALVEGHVVCIFAEGAVSRTGNLLPFKSGFEHIVKGLDVPVIPVYLDRVWGSIFSFKRERFFWKLPEHLPYPVTVAFGDPLPSMTTAGEARLAIMELGAEAMRHRRAPTDRLHRAFARVARRRPWRLAMADSTGQSLTFGRALMASMVLGRVLRRRTPDQDNVGLLLPASVGGALANIAAYMAGKVPVNLNFTVGSDALDAAVRQAEIKTIVTSSVFLRKANIEPRPEMVFLEDLRKEIGPADKIAGLLGTIFTPARWLGRRGGDASELATIVFSSGSTGVPKGVMLSHANLLANVDSLFQIFPMTPEDCFLGVLPFFHSFGLTGTLWFPLLEGCSIALHPNPMDAKTVGEMCAKYRVCMLISTPTFCQSYIRRCTKEQFAHLKYAIVGAEKLREPIARAFREQFGLDLLEGYGCTEMAPVVAVNRPNVTDGRERQVGNKPGTVGHPIPGVAAKIVDQNTGEGPLFNREGLLLVSGPNMMQGYLKQPERTAEVIHDGWYTTGDIGLIDDEGFIHITDRLSRFSKIAGEMVPHVRIEEAINGILGEAASAVTAVPDATRGERLVAFYTRADVTPDMLWEKLSSTDLPKIWLPKREALLQIEAIPTLGTGKTDLRRLRELATERAGVTV